MSEAKRGQVIPFGKYKGQEVGEFLGDEEYVKWLLAQPWFKQRYGNIYSVVINYYGQEAVETPEHNVMQVKFLKEEWRLRLSAATSPKRIAAWTDKAAINQKIQTDVVHIVRKDEKQLSYFQRPPLDLLRVNLPKKMPLSMLTIGKPKFEDDGADVSFSVGSEFCGFTAFDFYSLYRVELKPSLGDDFPEVLRQMKRNKCGQLLVNQYTGEGATEEEVVAFFQHENITMIFEHELEAVVLPDLNPTELSQTIAGAQAFAADPEIWTISNGFLVRKTQ